MATTPHRSPTKQQVLQIIQSNPGTPYSASDICELTDCSASQAQIALDALGSAGLAAPQESKRGLPPTSLPDRASRAGTGRPPSSAPWDCE